MKTIAITETMEQVHKHLEKYLALHREVTDERQVMLQGIQERWGDVSPSAVLEAAEVNSLVEARRKLILNPKSNPWVTTTVQGDLFHNVEVRIPSQLIIDGKARPYFEVSIIDGLEWWRARQDAKAKEANVFREAVEKCDDDSRMANTQAEILEQLVREAIDSGVDPKTVLYAKE